MHLKKNHAYKKRKTCSSGARCMSTARMISKNTNASINEHQIKSGIGMIMKTHILPYHKL